MIRTGYLRWEIEAGDHPCPQDPYAREVRFRARPSFRTVRIQGAGPAVQAIADRFQRGLATFAQYEAALRKKDDVFEHRVSDVGPHVFRYSQRDSCYNLVWWMKKVRGEARVFAHEVVRAGSEVPQLVVASRALRLGYAKLLEWETLRVIEGKSRPQPTNETEPMVLEAAQFHAEGIPELVAAELVRDVFTQPEFDEFASYDRVTLRQGGRIYRISRRTHAMIDVWNERDRKPAARLCVVFQDPGMPPSDEIVMKYLLARHEPDLLWEIANRFPPANGKPFEE